MLIQLLYYRTTNTQLIAVLLSLETHKRTWHEVGILSLGNKKGFERTKDYTSVLWGGKCLPNGGDPTERMEDKASQPLSRFLLTQYNHTFVMWKENPICMFTWEGKKKTVPDIWEHKPKRKKKTTKSCFIPSIWLLIIIMLGGGSLLHGIGWDVQLFFL